MIYEILENYDDLVYTLGTRTAAEWAITLTLTVKFSYLFHSIPHERRVEIIHFGVKCASLLCNNNMPQWCKLFRFRLHYNIAPLVVLWSTNVDDLKQVGSERIRPDIWKAPLVQELYSSKHVPNSGSLTIHNDSSNKWKIFSYAVTDTMQRTLSSFLCKQSWSIRKLLRYVKYWYSMKEKRLNYVHIYGFGNIFQLGLNQPSIKIFLLIIISFYTITIINCWIAF